MNTIIAMIIMIMITMELHLTNTSAYYKTDLAQAAHKSIHKRLFRSASPFESASLRLNGQ
eukprot:m.137831 g.137831  ORF g.137831 m.137831 type:complete len:60 (-) comp29952_c0_seq1:159-338(-)